MTLTIHQLCYRSNQKEILKNISISLQPGKLYGVLGPNGSGKTTLLKTIAGIHPLTSGKIHWQGRDLSQMTRRELSATLSIVPQTHPLTFDFTVYDMVAMGRYVHSHLNAPLIEQIMHSLHLWHLKDRYFSELSGGERQRVLIARTLVTEAPVLLLDEPTTHLDLYHQFEIWKILRSLVAEHRLIVVTLHDLAAAKNFCDEVLVLKSGECIATGKYAVTITPAVLKKVFNYHEDTMASISIN